MTTVTTVTSQPASSAAPDEPSPTPDSADARSLTDAPQPQSADRAAAGGIAAMPDGDSATLPEGSPGASADAAARGGSGRQPVSLGVLGGIFATLLAAMTAVLSMQIDSLADSMDARFAAIDTRFAAIDARFVSLEDRMDARFAAVDARFASLEAEMRAGFRDIRTVLLDHTDRLARLETAAGLQRAVSGVQPPAAYLP